ncbi:cut-like homeobox 1 [Planoprotostelium fungivorum]|uniref:Cut-like homeobox 1 n=1 Tax=Planoprotostelium fungivorum TaxID=1890364 RepID=A0A2P6NZI5_9EUKA|nr:cut-like homeobox 1 [Planoprotostelium fungivorum]
MSTSDGVVIFCPFLFTNLTSVGYPIPQFRRTDQYAAFKKDGDSQMNRKVHGIADLMGKRKKGEGESDDDKVVVRRRLELHQTQGLENYFTTVDVYPTTEAKEKLAQELDLKAETISKWFINRRVKLRNEEGKKSKGNDSDEEAAPKEKPSGRSRGAPAKVSSKASKVTGPRAVMARTKNIVAARGKSDPTTPASPQEQISEESYKDSPALPSADEADEPQVIKKKRKVEEISAPPPPPPEPKKEPVPLPLWKELYIEAEAIRAAAGPSAEHLARQQLMLDHILNTRKKQELPPVFAMITGPTIQPYRMEELSLVLGRNTPAHREADIHVSNSANINHLHAKIVFEDNCYNIINVSRRGFQLKTNKGWKEITGHMVKVPLPNPAVMNFQGSFIFVQCFYIRDADSLEEGSHVPPVIKMEPIVQIHDVSMSYEEPEPVYVPPPKPQTPAKATKASKRQAAIPVAVAASDERETPKQWSYASMISASIRHHGGEATYKQINEYIGEHFKDVVKDRRTWKNSVGGVLSSSGFFESIRLPSDDPTSKKRGGIWRISNRGDKLVETETTKQEEKAPAAVAEKRPPNMVSGPVQPESYDSSSSGSSDGSSSSGESDSEESRSGPDSGDEGPPILAMS